ncbi:MAG: ribonuclease D [Pseudomonadota bacterium]
MNLTTETLTRPVLIARNEDLNQLCSLWSKSSLLALDTEFIRIDTFFPKLGLIQVCDARGSYLLDPLTLTDWTAFNAILGNPSIIKVLHSCSEDLVVFKEFFGQLPSPIFDTQKAAAFLNFGYSISYQNLVKEVLSIEISKGETRSDWLRRPLSSEQLSYAALDVAYLPEIYCILKNLLLAKHRLIWLQSECEDMLALATSEVSESNWENYYQGVGSAWKLDSEQLAVLQRLCIWREREARRRDKPRSWIAKDSDLVSLAERRPKDKVSLSNIKELTKSLLNKDAEILLELVQTQHSGEPLKLGPLDTPLSPEMRLHLKKCQAVVQRIAEDLQIAPEMLARKRQLMPIVVTLDANKDFIWPAILSGWRQPLLEASIRKALGS